MQPSQCPACGRFLRAALVEGLPDGSAPCPGCGEPLEAAMFGDRPAERDAPAAAHGPATPRRDRAADRAPGEGWNPDPLAGWDRGVGPAEVAGWRVDEPPLPVDGMVVLGSALVGGLLGWALTDRHRVRSAAAGTLLGAVGGGVARRVWRLPG